MVRLAVSSASALVRSSSSLLVQRTATAASTRSFSILPSLRPTTATSTTSSTVFRTSQTPLARLPFPTTTTTAEGAVVDIIPSSSISAHPSFGGIASQIRCGPRNTHQKSTRLIQKRRHGFLSRIRTKNGRKMLARRRADGRKKLGH